MVLYRSFWNHLTVGKQMSFGSFYKKLSTNYSFTNHTHLISIHVYKQDLANPTQPNPIYLMYMYKEDLALKNLQSLICHKTHPS